MQQRIRAGIFSQRAEQTWVTAVTHLSACTKVRQECAVSLGGMGRKTRVTGTKHNPGSPLARSAKLSLLKPLGKSPLACNH